MATAQQVVDKWLRNAGGASQSYREAVQAVTESPMERAAAKANEWQAAVSDPRTRERFVSGLRRVNLEEWKRKAAEVGANRYAQGIQAASSKFRAFMESFYPLTQEVKARVRAMPKMTEEDSINRVRAVITAFKQFKR
jgi:hypothetical protein